MSVGVVERGPGKGKGTCGAAPIAEGSGERSIGRQGLLGGKGLLGQTEWKGERRGWATEGMGKEAPWGAGGGMGREWGRGDVFGKYDPGGVGYGGKWREGIDGGDVEHGDERRWDDE